MKTGESDTAALPWALASVGLWSTVAVAFKTALAEIRPLDLLALACFVSWVSLGCVLLVRRQVMSPVGRPLRRKGIMGSLILGLLNPLLYYLVLFDAYNRLPASAAQPLNYTWPLFLALLAAPLAGKRPEGREVVGLGISLAGVTLVSLFAGGEIGALDVFGVLLAVGSGLIWASSWLLSARLELDGPLRLFLGFSAALLVLLPIWLLQGPRLPQGFWGWTAVVWSGLFEMGITFLFWQKALESAHRPARIANLVYIGPFLSLLWIRLILQEPIHHLTVVGLAIIVGGILWGRRRAPT